MLPCFLANKSQREVSLHFSGILFSSVHNGWLQKRPSVYPGQQSHPSAACGQWLPRTSYSWSKTAESAGETHLWAHYSRSGFGKWALYIVSRAEQWHPHQQVPVTEQGWWTHPIRCRVAKERLFSSLFDRLGVLLPRCLDLYLPCAGGMINAALSHSGLSA